MANDANIAIPRNVIIINLAGALKSSQPGILSYNKRSGIITPVDRLKIFNSGPKLKIVKTPQIKTQNHV